MNSNNVIKYCPNCGKKNINNGNMCMVCGLVFNNSNNMPRVVTTPPKKDSSGTFLLALSIINVTFIVPAVLYFGVLYLLFGGLSNVSNATHLFRLSMCSAYIVGSIVALIAFIINKIKENTVLKSSIIWIIIGFIVGYFIPHIISL